MARYREERDCSGAANNRSKLRWDQVREIRENPEQLSQRALARKFRVSQPMVCKIQRGRAWVETEAPSGPPLASRGSEGPDPDPVLDELFERAVYRYRDAYERRDARALDALRTDYPQFDVRDLHHCARATELI